MNPSERQPNILVVDDTPENLQLLTRLLTERGYRARPVSSGRFALRAAENDPPDLILLDVNMPELNGYEVCRRLKENEDLKDIPVIFISALSETLDKVRAFSSGGVDYVTKPFQFEEVEARVRTHLELRRLRIELEEQYHQLQELESLRDSLTDMIIHDLRSPLSGVMAYLELVHMKEDELQDDTRDWVERALQSSNTLLEMISALLDVNRFEQGSMPLDLKLCYMAEVAEEAIESLGGVTLDRTVRLERPERPCLVRCDRDIIRRVVANLVANGLKFTPDGGSVVVTVSRDEASARVSVQDNGRGVPPEYREKIFEKFGQVEARKEQKKYSTGLGLAFCKLAVEAHGGRIGVESEVGKGSDFWFELPAREDG